MSLRDTTDFDINIVGNYNSILDITWTRALQQKT